jgi:anti-anti-sigma regulatory factor
MQADHYQIGEEYRILNGREIGIELRQKILSHIHLHGFDKLYYIDFSNVEFLDFSSADELIRGLLDELTARQGGLRNIVLYGTSPPVRENVSAVLELRKSVCLTENGQDAVHVLGTLSAPLKATLEVVFQNKRVTARDVADHFRVAINTASNRLASLAELGLIVRTGKRTVVGGGEENLFESLV